MQLMSTIERYGYERGFKEGRRRVIQKSIQQGREESSLEGERRVLEFLLRFKFKSIPAHYCQQIVQSRARYFVEMVRAYCKQRNFE